MGSEVSFSCQSCNTKFKIGEEKVPSNRVLKFKCPSCGSNNALNLNPSVESDKTVIVRQKKQLNTVGAKLMVYDQNETLIKRVILKMGKNIFGRLDNTEESIQGLNDNEKAMSRTHFQIDVKKNAGNQTYEYIIHDLKSTNGLIVNGSILDQLAKIYLNDNDVITIGNTHILFQFIKL
jgi:predicted Zn finger-like uncharacterized protein